MRKKFLNEIINQTSDETKRSAKEYANNLKRKVMSKYKIEIGDNLGCVIQVALIALIIYIISNK